jgi:NAD(P)-dependent dehydrogenase (short-subunit alcohol dehydrogenase family)
MKTFESNSTTDDVLEGIDLSGKRVLITGVSAGLGIETARVCAAHGAEVTGTVRDMAKGLSATSAIRPLIDLVELDLASLDSVRACADTLLDAGSGFDVVIANAGVMVCPQGVTADGFETQFGTNHLGHFVLINRIRPLLRGGARVVVLSSLGHRIADVDLEDPNFASQAYSPSLAYGRSKTANALFAVEFDRRNCAQGIRAISVHPGGIHTELGRHVTPDVMRDFQIEVARVDPGFDFSQPLATKSVPQGAATSVWAAFVGDAAQIGGRYCEDCHLAAVNDCPGFIDGVRSYAQDQDRARALWALSERMVGETFD